MGDTTVEVVDLSLPPAELLKEGKKLRSKCGHLLEELEKGDTALIAPLAQNISILQQVSDTLYRASFSISDSLSAKRIQEFIQSVKQISSSSESHILKHQKKIRENLEREELLTQRKHGEFELHIGDEYERQMEIREKSRASLQSSHNLADSIISSSYEVLERLQGQREMITRIRGRLNDIGSAIGISDQLIRTIDRRVSQDKWIVYGGMVGVIVLIIILYYIFAD